MRFIGVEGGHVHETIGRFDPDKHKGVDVFAPAGSRVFVPRGWRIKIVQTSFDPKYYKGQARGWARICDEDFGFVAAHLAEEPAAGLHLAGDQIGRVSGNVQFTPHIHWALAKGHMPPPGEVDPVIVWRRCKAS